MATIQEDIVRVCGAIKTYPLQIPSDGTAVYPCVVYQRITTKQFRHMTGLSLERPHYQLSIWDEPEHYDRCVSTANAVKVLFDLNQVDWQICYKDNESEPMPDEAGYYQIILDLIFLK